MDRRRLLAPVLGVLLLGSLLLLPRLGASGLWDPWEPRYVQSAKEMTQRGDFVVPYYRDSPRVNKAPLTYWLVAGSHAAFGSGEGASRLPGALLAILGALALALGFTIRNRGLEGFLAGAALLTGPQWPLVGRFATPDMPLAASLALLLGVVLAWPALTDLRARRAALGLGLLSLAAAGLADWPRGLLLPAWAVMAWAAFERRLWAAVGLGVVAALYHLGQLLQNAPLNLIAHACAAAFAAIALGSIAGIAPRRMGVGAAVVLLLVAPWFIALSVSLPEGEELSLFRYKYAFNLGEDFGEHNGPYLQVARLVALGGLPWTAAAVVGLWFAFAREREPIARVLAGAATAGWLFFTLAEAQMGHFYGVLQPAIAGLAALGLVAAARRSLGHSLVIAAGAGALAFLAFDRPATLLETATVKSSLYGIDLGRPAIAAIGVWLAAVLIAGWRRRPGWLLAAVLPTAAFAGYLSLWVVPALEPQKSVAPMWRRYLEARAGDEPIALYGDAKDGAFYYSDNGIARLENRRELGLFLDRHRTGFLILPERDLNEVAETATEGHCESIETSHPSHVLIRCATIGD